MQADAVSSTARPPARALLLSQAESGRWSLTNFGMPIPELVDEASGECTFDTALRSAMRLHWRTGLPITTRQHGMAVRPYRIRGGR